MVGKENRKKRERETGKNWRGEAKGNVKGEKIQQKKMYK